MKSRLATLLVAAASLVGAPGCWSVFTAAAWVVMPFYYDHAELPSKQVIRDVPYRQGPGSDAVKHRLDLYLPDPDASGERPWPVLVFVHGGGWTSGDKGYRLGGRDVYGNIGRWFAREGVGTAVISYRLQFDVTWRDQVEDVAVATAVATREARRLGGDPGRLFLSGHSAGAQLSTYVSFDAALRARHGVPEVCGLVSVSGTAYDLSDEQTYELGAPRSYYEKRFRANEPRDAWKEIASPIRSLTPNAPPTLLVVAEEDWPALHHQARLLRGALRELDVPVEFMEIEGVDHFSIVATLSRADRPTAPAILDFIRSARCGRSGDHGTQSAGG